MSPYFLNPKPRFWVCSPGGGLAARGGGGGGGVGGLDRIN